MNVPTFYDFARPVTVSLMRHLAIIALLFTLAGPSFAADEEHPAPAGAAAADPNPHPGVPQHPSWAKNMVAIIGLMFLAAFLIGPLVRAAMPQEVEPPHSHDEHGGGAHDDPHGHAPGHGHTGHH